MLLDVSNFWPQVQRRGSEEFFLIRFEKGRQIHRVKRPEAEPFKDLAHYEVFGPTVIATNHLAPPEVPLSYLPDLDASQARAIPSA